MINNTLQELWEIKDGIAKENGYDIDRLVSYLRSKSQLAQETLLKFPQNIKAEQGASTDRHSVPHHNAR